MIALIAHDTPIGKIVVLPPGDPRIAEIQAALARRERYVVNVDTVCPTCGGAGWIACPAHGGFGRRCTCAETCECDGSGTVTVPRTVIKVLPIRAGLVGPFEASKIAPEVGEWLCITSGGIIRQSCDGVILKTHAGAFDLPGAQPGGVVLVVAGTENPQ